MISIEDEHKRILYSSKHRYIYFNPFAILYNLILILVLFISLRIYLHRLKYLKIMYEKLFSKRQLSISLWNVPTQVQPRTWSLRWWKAAPRRCCVRWICKALASCGWRTACPWPIQRGATRSVQLCTSPAFYGTVTPDSSPVSLQSPRAMPSRSTLCVSVRHWQVLYLINPNRQLVLDGHLT